MFDRRLQIVAALLVLATLSPVSARGPPGSYYLERRHPRGHGSERRHRRGRGSERRKRPIIIVH